MTPLRPSGWACCALGTTWHRLRAGWPLCATWGPYHGPTFDRPPPTGRVCVPCTRKADKRARQAAAWRHARTLLRERQEAASRVRDAATVLRHRHACVASVPYQADGERPRLSRRAGRYSGTTVLPSPAAGQLLVVLVIDQRDAPALGALDLT